MGSSATGLYWFGLDLGDPESFWDLHGRTSPERLFKNAYARTLDPEVQAGRMTADERTERTEYGYREDAFRAWLASLGIAEDSFELVLGRSFEYPHLGIAAKGTLVESYDKPKRVEPAHAASFPSNPASWSEANRKDIGFGTGAAWDAMARALGLEGEAARPAWLLFHHYG